MKRCLLRVYVGYIYIYVGCRSEYITIVEISFRKSLFYNGVDPVQGQDTTRSTKSVIDQEISF